MPRGAVKRAVDGTVKSVVPATPAAPEAPKDPEEEALEAKRKKYMGMPRMRYQGVVDNKTKLVGEAQAEVRELEKELIRVDHEKTGLLAADMQKRDEKRAAEAKEVEGFRAVKQQLVVERIASLVGDQEQINRRGFAKREHREFMLMVGELAIQQQEHKMAACREGVQLETDLYAKLSQEQAEHQVIEVEAREKHRQSRLKNEVMRKEIERLHRERDEFLAVGEEWGAKETAALQAVGDAKKALNHHEDERRKLHNKIEELKGNIRVFCRIRSPIADARDTADFDIDASKKHLQVRGKERAALAGDSSKAEDHSFRYDHVFGTSATQEDVFSEVSPLVQSCLDGFRVCIFAYGQTGSGKTYTMEGPPNNKGVIPRAVNMIFEKVTELQKERGFKCSLSCSFVEIYNDTLRDLLGKKGAPPPQLRLVSGKDGGVDVEGMSAYDVSDSATVGELLATAQGNRACAATKMNDQSSRSHSVFMLRITTHNPITGVTLSGLLNLIDLAGSEKVDSSGVTGDRLREARAINSSLSHLGDVIHSLGTGGHVPFRNCTLTKLLRPSLGGSSKCLMLVNTSPFKEHIEETVKSLRFAKRVNSTKVGVAKRSME
eukprot:TRINITY_DN702_c1_g3_i1.p1 TRINITY_DN702_c1_g3~~TRINITY_DN702_c1_g3_i1.p1  ORF type:complete len:666 (+),score=282.23 TRINITY_DN702_c1_g3_i1:187-1998(+)